MSKKYFGSIVADIRDENRQVLLSVAPPGRDQLDDDHLDRCLNLAVDSLADLKAKGYKFLLIRDGKK